jgi:hypothetical protein
MLQIVPLVDRLVPGLLGHTRPSIVCICTTRPKYLVFNGNTQRPACVVEFGPADRLESVHRVQSELHDRLPNRIPRSICCVPHPWKPALTGSAPGLWEPALAGSVPDLWEPALAGSIRLKADPTACDAKADPTACVTKADPTACDTKGDPTECSAKQQASTFVHIQEGLPGTPWFRLSDRIVTAADWERLITRAVTVMGELHDAIAAVPSWMGQIDLGLELTRQARKLEASQIAVSPTLRREIEKCCEVLGAIGAVRGVRQHGDFAVNNLLVSADSIAIIDFDEFGRTLVPLHDAFGLALSLALSQEGRWPLPRTRCVKLCVERSLVDGRIGREHLPGLLMHHLLCRINLCDGVERRARLRQTLLDWAEELATNPATFFGDVF